MEEKKKTEKGELSYERLQEICGELSQRLQMAQRKIEEIDASNTVYRLNFLFKVIENAALFDPSFIESTVKEIQDTLTLPEEEEKK